MPTIRPRRYPSPPDTGTTATPLPTAGGEEMYPLPGATSGPLYVQAGSPVSARSATTLVSDRPARTNPPAAATPRALPLNGTWGLYVHNVLPVRASSAYTSCSVWKYITPSWTTAADL